MTEFMDLPQFCEHRNRYAARHQNVGLGAMIDGEFRRLFHPVSLHDFDIYDRVESRSGQAKQFAFSATRTRRYLPMPQI
jgi:hypothetical protein